MLQVGNIVLNVIFQDATFLVDSSPGEPNLTKNQNNNNQHMTNHVGNGEPEMNNLSSQDNSSLQLPEEQN